MLEKKRQNNPNILQKANHVGMALFVFVVLAGTSLWLTGNLHFGPLDAAEAGDIHTDTHEHEQAPQVNDPSTHDVGSPGESGTLGQALCEHGIATIECDRCRFEIGVVKLQPSLAKTLVETAEVQDVERVRTLRLTGQVQLDSTRVVDVVPTGSGQVKRVEKLLGQEVVEGDMLAVIYSADFGQAKAHFLEEQARLDLATSTFEREKDLYETKVSSKADYLNALNELKAAQAYYAAAEKTLRLFGLDSEQISAIKDEKENGRFAELVLRAPQAGTIIAQNISVGALVDTTESLYTIADTSNVWVWCDLYERNLKLLHERLSSGERIITKVRVKAFVGESFDGIVDLIGTQVDEHTRTIKVRVQVKNEEQKLKPGMFAEAEISIPLQENAMIVPSSAVVSDEGKSFVFQHLKDDLWMRRDVRVGENQGGFIEILSGLPKNATIVTGGAFMLKSDILREKMGAGCAD